MRSLKLIGSVLVLTIASLIPPGETAADEPFSADLLRKVEELIERDSAREEEIAELRNKLAEVQDDRRVESSVSTMLGEHLSIGGFLTQTLTYANGDDGSELSPNQTLLELLFRAEITDRVHLFAATGFLREADLDYSNPAKPTFRKFANRVPLILGWMNYRHADLLQLTVGRFVTPHGIINREHFPPLLLDINQPQFLRPFSGSTIFPNFLNGGMLHGFAETGGLGFDSFEYSVYAGVFNQAADRGVEGLRVAPTWDDPGLTVGFNYAHGSRDAGGGPLGNASVVPAESTVKNDYDLAGIDVLIDKGPILWKTEFYYSFEGGENDRWTVYTQPAWRITDRWIAFYRYDYLDPGQGVDSVEEHLLGLNFLPVPAMRIRGTFGHKNFHNTSHDVFFSQLSATFSF